MNRKHFLGSMAQTGLGVALVGASAVQPRSEEPLLCTEIMSLDGVWLLATDPNNVGLNAEWFRGSLPSAAATRVPWIIQDAFPGYHGLAWYWREFSAPPNRHAGGRYLLRFWAVDYKADVWLNGAHIGGHEGGETPFVLDATDTVLVDESNLLAVRVLNPTHERIDGITLSETPHRNKALPYTAGSAWNQGGIVDSVELILCPQVRIEDVFATCALDGNLHVDATLHNAGSEALARVHLSVALAPSGETIATSGLAQVLSPGRTSVPLSLRIPDVRLWELAEPNLYRVTVRAQAEGSTSYDERTVQVGVREFRFERGYFRLNGRRVYLKCSHTGNCCPVGLELPPDPDMLRRDLLNVKAMGFNAIRFIAGIPKRYQLDLCDQIGLMVYEECYAAWCLADSPSMKERFDRSVAEMIMRDRNHPSVVIWGLLNETPEGPVFRNAVASLPLVRSLDPSRMVFLNSGRWDAQVSEALAGLQVWRRPERTDPCVTHNPTDRTLTGLGITWEAGRLALHPGMNGEYSVIRWSCPSADRYVLRADFEGISTHTTTDVHVLHNGRPLHDGLINVQGASNASAYEASVDLVADDTIDCVVGFGNGDYGSDTTGLRFRLTSARGDVYDAASDFSLNANPNGVWSYGYSKPGPVPDLSELELYTVPETIGAAGQVGTLANPGSLEWEDALADTHPYQRVPHTAETIHHLRTLGEGPNPMFVSEYGIGSAVDLWRAVRHYERIGKEHAEDAVFYRDKLDRFMADWQRWRMYECFASPEQFFAESNRRMGRERLRGLNALRANPNVVGHSLTGTVDQGMTGEGLFTTFRELKPGTVDAVFEAWAPLRFCLFVEPVHVYRGTSVRLEAVLANEDALRPGEYPVRLAVVGPDMHREFETLATLTVPEPDDGQEPAFAQLFFSEQVAIAGGSGRYRFLATMEQGGAPAGGETEFYVADRADMPPVDAEVTLWGDDTGLAAWLAGNDIAYTQGSAAAATGVMLVSGSAPEWDLLLQRIEDGASAVFLSPDAFRLGDDPTGRLPLVRRGTVTALPSWLYHKEEWAKPHPVFDGLPTGLMDYTYYRELIPDVVFAGQEDPVEAIAGANQASIDYSSGLLVATYRLGRGLMLLNTLRIREHLGAHPAADRLLRNMLRYMASAV